MTTKTNLFAILATLLTTAAVHAEGAAAPPPEAKKLARFNGTWRGTGTFQADGQKTTFTWLIACSPIALGHGLQCRFSAKGIPVVPVYEGSSVLGWDKETDTVHWYWVTNAGEVHDHRGRWTDANTLDVPFDGKEGGKPMRETFTLTFAGPRELRWTSYYSIDGKVVMTMEAQGRK